MMGEQTAPEVWRTGRSVGRTVYRQVGDGHAEEDELIGVMDSPELAALVVDAVNAWTAPADTGEPT